MVAALVQHEPSRSPLAVSFERDLRIHDLQKIIAVALWKYLDLFLPGGLRKQAVAFTCNRQNEIRCQLIAANISIEKLGIDSDLFVFFRGRSLPQFSSRVYRRPGEG
jgi:hypothetical protein